MVGFLRWSPRRSPFQFFDADDSFIRSISCSRRSMRLSSSGMRLMWLNTIHTIHPKTAAEEMYETKIRINPSVGYRQRGSETATTASSVIRKTLFSLVVFFIRHLLHHSKSGHPTLVQYRER